MLLIIFYLLSLCLGCIDIQSIQPDNNILIIEENENEIEICDCYEEYKNKNEINEIQIKGNVTKIGNECFSNFTNEIKIELNEN